VSTRSVLGIQVRIAEPVCFRAFCPAKILNMFRIEDYQALHILTAREYLGHILHRYDKTWELMSP